MGEGLSLAGSHEMSCFLFLQIYTEKTAADKKNIIKSGFRLVPEVKDFGFCMESVMR